MTQTRRRQHRSDGKRLNLIESTGSGGEWRLDTADTARTNPDATPTPLRHRWTNLDAKQNMGGNLLVSADAKKRMSRARPYLESEIWTRSEAVYFPF